MKNNKKRAKHYEKPLKINASFGDAVKAIVSDVKVEKKRKKG